MNCLKNSIKNLFRTNGMITNLIGIFFIAFFMFTSYYVLSLFFSWKGSLKDSPAESTTVSIYIILVAILFFTLLIFLILYTKNTFKAFFYMQKKDILTMSFLGGSYKQIGNEFALQPTICSLLLLPLSSVLGKKIVVQFNSDFMYNLKLMVSVKSELLITVIIILSISLISYLSIYLYIKRMIVA